MPWKEFKVCVWLNPKTLWKQIETLTTKPFQHFMNKFDEKV